LAEGAGETGFQDVQPHDIARGIVQDEIQEIERDYPRQALGQVMKEGWEVAMHSNRLGYFEQRLATRKVAVIARCRRV